MSVAHHGAAQDSPVGKRSSIHPSGMTVPVTGTQQPPIEPRTQFP